MAKKKFYITTAIDYPSAMLHIGHCYEKIIADIFARWHRLNGEHVFFLTGADEHGQKIQRCAEVAGKTPKEFVDFMVGFFKKVCTIYNISYDWYIRTTDKKHIDIAINIFNKIHEKNEIYKGIYRGLYCIECENFYLEKELTENKCPVHNKELSIVSEDTHFFKLGNYHKQVVEHIKKHPEFIFPYQRRNEIVVRLQEKLRDLSISRTTIKWGIPLPTDKDYTLYVWFDALLNYISGINYPTAKYEKYWPADVQVIGKDILWFHAVIWPAILFASNIQLPRKLLVHGFINDAHGEKMSKAKGNVIDPLKLAEKYDIDSIRYYLARDIPLGEDGNFSEEAMVERHNRELANDLGNLLNRVLSMAEKYFGGKIRKNKVDKWLASRLNFKEINSFVDNFELHNSLAEIWKFVNECNRYVNEKKPWESDNKEEILYNLLEGIRIIGIIVAPFIPNTTDKINKQLGVKRGNFGDIKFGLIKNYKIKKGDILFKKIVLT